MTALLPLDEQPITVDFANGRLEIAQGEDTKLQERDGRKQLLRRRLASSVGDPWVDFIDLVNLLRGAPIPPSNLVVVFDRDTDQSGHKGPEQFPGLVGTFVEDLRRAVEALHRDGIETVHVVTDHGFLFLPADRVNDLGDPKVPVVQTYCREDRWAALKPGAPVSDVIVTAAPLSPTLQLGFPRGVRTLEKTEQYLHGGLSPQECILPHLVSRRSLQRPQLGIALNVTSPKLSTGVIPVVVRPETTQGQVPLGGYEPVHVRLWVETTEDHRTVAGPVEFEMQAGAEQVRPALYLDEGSKLTAGQSLRLRACNTETGQDLGSEDLVLVVNWD